LTDAELGHLTKLEIDFATGSVVATRKGDGVWITTTILDFDDPRAFELVATAWLRVAWDCKYQWTFSWLGRPIIQLPEDLIRVQELIWRLRPDVIVETGVAHGGSLVFYATLCKALNHGRVIGVELPRSPEQDRSDAIMAHELSDFIEIVHGDSIDPDVVDQVHALVDDDETVLLLLDSAHSKAHVLAELEAYSDLVTPGSYAIVQDGFMMQLAGADHAPRTERDWAWNNPLEAAKTFVAKHRGWRIDPPSPPFDESVGLGEGVTHWTGGWIRRAY